MGESVQASPNLRKAWPTAFAQAVFSRGTAKGSTIHLYQCMPWFRRAKKPAGGPLFAGAVPRLREVQRAHHRFDGHAPAFLPRLGWLLIRVQRLVARAALRGEMGLRPHPLLERAQRGLDLGQQADVEATKKCGKDIRRTLEAARDSRRHPTSKLARGRHSDRDVLASEAERCGQPSSPCTDIVVSQSGSERRWRTRQNEAHRTS